MQQNSSSRSAHSMTSNTDAEYLQRMVGDVLAQGCAAVTALRPDAPVESLAAWLQGQAPAAVRRPPFADNPSGPVITARAVLTRC